MKRIAIAILILLVVIAGIGGTKFLQIQALMAAGKNFAQPPETISTAVVKEEKWQGTLSAIGSIIAVQGGTLTPDIPGTIREIAFESGAVVAKGDLLVRLDTSSEQAQLQAVEAQTELARLNAERERALRAQK